MIGVVTHSTHGVLFREAASTLRGVDLEWVSYDHEENVRDKVAEFLSTTRLDGFLAGPVPYTASRELLPPGLPVGVVRPSALDLTLALYRAQQRGWGGMPVSIDTFPAEAVEAVTSALELDQDQITSLPYAPTQSVEEIIEFHRSAYRRFGDRGYVISVRAAVREQLADDPIGIMSGMPVPATIRTELHELALRIESDRASAQRFAAGVFLISQSADEERARVGLMNLLLNTPEFAGAWIEDRGRRGVVVFAHKALFERVTRNWVAVPALAEAGTALGAQVSAGFGVGVSARNCVLLAEQAAARAEQEDEPCAYLIEDSGVIIGPMGPLTTSDREALSFSYREHGEHVEQLAKSVGLSAATVSRLAALDHELEGRAISPGELADRLGITDQSGRRLIRTLDAGGLVSDEGTAQHHPKGRPTRLYRLRIAQSLLRTQKKEQEPWSSTAARS
ncbi:transcriptional regulator [Kribbella albertanoniae]|uniref:Transcriptional regulator n=1 Tax=Kribbella albertanoniae TaxID=1266829 RepID=A0A4R4PQS2_9ACTN|nr:transcriptional regulator [Kribbella albertanoniae]